MNANSDQNQIVTQSIVLAYSQVQTTNKGITRKPHMASDDRFSDWCSRLQASDHSAFEEVFHQLYDPLLNYAVYLIKSRPVALDLVQETFLKLWEKRETLNPEKSLKSLLYLIVRNLAFNHQRDKASRDAKLATNVDRTGIEIDSPDDMFAAGVLKGKMDEWINSLPLRQREALILSRFQGLSHQEVAAVMDVSPRTVNNHLVRALKYIHGQIQSYEPSLLDS